MDDDLESLTREQLVAGGDAGNKAQSWGTVLFKLQSYCTHVTMMTMRRSLRRDLNVLRAYVILSGSVLVFLASAAVSQPAGPQQFGEINVERFNIVDANGTLRMVISNKDRMHPGVLDGKTIDRPRPSRGCCSSTMRETRSAA